MSDWKPEVGDDFELYYANNWQQYTLLHIDDSNNYVVIYKDNGRAYVISGECAVRPINEADKQRDEQIEKIKNLGFEQMQSEMLYRHGCRVIAPDEHIVKALTEFDMQMLWDYQDWQINESEFTAVAKAVQRELGIKL